MSKTVRSIRVTVFLCCCWSLAGQESVPQQARPLPNAEELLALSSLELGNISQGAEWPQANSLGRPAPAPTRRREIREKAWAPCRSVLWIDLQGGSRRFTASVGVDDEVVKPTVLRELITSFQMGHPVTP